MRIRRLLLGKQRGTVTTAPIALTVIYNGSNQILVSAGQGTGNMLYKLNNGSWSYDRPQALNVNTYTVYYKAEENKKYKESEIGSVTAAIAKVIPTVTAPTPETLTYNTQAQSLVSAGSTNWGTLKYSLDNKTYSTNIPTATDAGKYKVYYRVDGDSNIEDVAAAYVDVTISPKTVSSPTITLGTNSYVYNGQEKKPTVSSVKDGNVTIASTEYTVSYTNNINAGTATCVITDKSGGNYTVSGTKTYTISKADTTYTAPTAKTLTYNGESQSLLNAGTVSGGNVKYSSDNSTWSDTIPSKTTAGTYTSYWKIVGDSNHNDKSSVSIETTIAKKALNASVSITGWNYGDTANSPSISGNDGNGTVTYNYKLSSAADSTYSATVPTDAGNYTVRAVIATTTNYLGTTVTTTFTIAKVNVTYTAPTSKQNLVYNGSAQDLLNAGTVIGGTMKYSKDEVTWSTSIPQFTSAALYTSYWRIDGDSNHNDYRGGMLSTRISKATGTATISSVTSDYTGSAQDMISVSGNTGTMHYRVGTNGTWQDTKPTRTVVGSDTIYYYMDPSTNYFAQGSESEPWGSVTSTIHKATRSGFAVSMANWTYGTTASNPSVSNNYENGTVTYSYKVNGADDSTYTSTKPSDVGTYVIKAVAAATDNYKESTATTTFSIVNLNPSYTAPTAKSLTYSGSALSLLNAGSTNDGTIQYSSDGSTWSTNIPTATNAGSHNTYWRLVGDAQHKDIASTKIVVTIDKKSINPSVSMSSWTYGGTASSPSVSGNDGSGTVTYKYKVSGAADSTYSSTKPSNAGTYTVIASIDSTTNYNSATCTTNFTISKADPTYSAPTAKTGLIYSGNSQTLYNAGSNTTAGSFSYTNGTRTNAGTQTVSWSFTPTDTTNYNSKSGSFDATISKANISPSVSMSGWTYGETASNPSVSGNSGSGGVTYYYKESYQGDGSYTTTKPSNAGTYTIKAVIDTTTNYTEGSCTNTFTISKANPSYTTPTATSPTYNGSGQLLLNAGSSSNGTMLYSSDNSNWSISIPTGTNAGSYTSYWRIVGDSNHNNASGSISTTISKATGSASVGANSLTYNGSAQVLVTLNNNTGTMLYSLNNSDWYYDISEMSETYAGTYTVYWICNASTNYTLVTGSVSITIAKATPKIVFNYPCKTLNCIPEGGSVLLSATTTNTQLSSIVFISSAQNNLISISGNLVTGLQVNYGSVIITATSYETADYNAAYAQLSFQVVPALSGIPYVEIDGVKWLSGMAGASSSVRGDWYAWGEKNTHSGAFDWSHYPLNSTGTNDIVSLTKYNSSDQYDELISPDDDIIWDELFLETTHNTFGRIASKDEWLSLINATSSTAITDSLHTYICFTETSTSKKVLVPIMGVRLDSSWNKTVPAYWTRNLDTTDKLKAIAINLNTSGATSVYRYSGLGIKGVITS